MILQKCDFEFAFWNLESGHVRKHNSNFHTQKRAQMGPVKESECF
jgi:hypothetical protein